MATAIKMPQLGLTMEEGTLVKWLKKEGDPVAKGDPICEIQSDKSIFEEEAFDSGILLRILVPEGAVVPVGTDIALIGAAGEEISPAPVPAADLPEPAVNQSNLDAESKITPVSENADGVIKASPAAKKIAREKGVALHKVTPTGPEGRILEKDVLQYISNRENASKPKEAVPMDGMRKAIAAKMVKSKTEIPHWYISTEADLTELLALREKKLPEIEAAHGIRPTINDILVKIVANALRENPVINSSIDGESIIQKRDINVGIAVALDNGLIVPVIKNADQKLLWEISKEARRLIDLAKQGKLVLADYQGGTFTVSNLGAYEIKQFVSIINPPESAILAVGRITKQPVVINDGIAIRSLISLTLSCDHRVIDGAQGARFLTMIKRQLEKPDTGLFG